MLRQVICISLVCERKINSLAYLKPLLAHLWSEVFILIHQRCHTLNMRRGSRWMLSVKFLLNVNEDVTLWRSLLQPL
ncbi:hypothetical protein [Nostoc sp. UHCC 0252]|uniref:hypothetical protein n=1 Tax=Nostoc sp. UHCC 0252 TaxID=3110241 RepID=UPI002B1EEFBB|nr:hypothetical protein [Nostoc sp. UHCC 0252]MEA5604754.1 hypothetical protein [Nostoc sp. UHCC 0252]